MRVKITFKSNYMYKTVFLFLFFSLHFHAQSRDNCRYAFLHLPENTAKQLQLAENILNKSLSESQTQAIINAHNIGTGEPGRDGSPAAVGNYTYIQLLQKTRILRQAGFTRNEVRTLMENKVVGMDISGYDLLSSKRAKIFPSEIAMAEIGLKILNKKFSEIPNTGLLKMGEETKRKIDEIVSQLSPEEVAAVLLYYEFRHSVKDDNRSRNDNISWEILTSTVVNNHLFLDTSRPVSEKVFFTILPYPFLSDKQVEAIPLKMIENIPLDMMGHINSFTAYFMTLEQIKVLSPDQIRKINPRDMKVFFTTEKINAMTPEQINAITSEQKTEMSIELGDAVRARIYDDILSRTQDSH
jgi:hypothetical protein